MLRGTLASKKPPKPRLAGQARNRPPLPVHSAGQIAGKLTRHPQMKQHLAVSAIGSDRTGMVHELTRVISESGGNISESRMANLGTESPLLPRGSGNSPC